MQRCAQGLNCRTPGAACGCGLMSNSSRRSAQQQHAQCTAAAGQGSCCAAGTRQMQPGVATHQGEWLPLLRRRLEAGPRHQRRHSHRRCRWGRHHPSCPRHDLGWGRGDKGEHITAWCVGSAVGGLLLIAALYGCGELYEWALLPTNCVPTCDCQVWWDASRPHGHVTHVQHL